jgi:membrane fusion protein (multidrug efflux system)
MKIAFIGLGIMGRPMAGHLKTAGHAITVVERKSLTAEDRAAFAVAPDAKTAAAGAEVALVRPDGSLHPVKGRVDFAATQIDVRLGTVQLRARFANPDGDLLAGQFVRARVTGRKAKDATFIPQLALVQAPSGRSVFVIGAGDRAEARPVTLGQAQGADVAVLAGLSAGDRVILNQLHKLRPGSPVVVAPATK